MKLKTLITLTLLNFFCACGQQIDESALQKDAEQMANDKCNMVWVDTKIKMLEAKLNAFSDSMKTIHKPESDPIMKEMIHERLKLRDKVDYYKEQKKGYQQNDQDEEARLRSERYQTPELWQKLVVRAEEILKTKNCKSTDQI